MRQDELGSGGLASQGHRYRMTFPRTSNARNMARDGVSELGGPAWMIRDARVVFRLTGCFGPCAVECDVIGAAWKRRMESANANNVLLPMKLSIRTLMASKHLRSARSKMVRARALAHARPTAGVEEPLWALKELRVKVHQVDWRK